MPVIDSKAGYAAVTAAALHTALRACRIEHAVVGYTTTPGPHVPNERDRSNAEGDRYLRWSRSDSALEMHVFVEAPGTGDDGAALPFITGRSANLDGESVLWAARYAAEHGGHMDRVILIVVADGLPSGCDDYAMNGPFLTEAVERTAQAGIEVYGVAVCTDFAKFAEFYPDRKEQPGRAATGAVEIKSAEGLSDQVLRELARLLTRGFGMSRRVARAGVVQ